MWSRMGSVAVALCVAAVLAGCGGGGGNARVEAAQTYFDALAAADYDTMAAVSTGAAQTAARYGQQVQAADPDAFGARDLTVIEPLTAAGDGAVDGSLELSTKDLDDGGLRIGAISAAEVDGSWLVADYERDGRPVGEIFREAFLQVISADDVQVLATLLLTDDASGVLIVPVAVQAGDAPVTIDPGATTATAGGDVALTSFEGPLEIPASSERIVVLVFRDVPRPSAAATVTLAVEVDGQPRELVLDLRPAGG